VAARKVIEQQYRERSGQHLWQEDAKRRKVEDFSACSQKPSGGLSMLTNPPGSKETKKKLCQLSNPTNLKANSLVFVGDM
jgi:hypothetical protein